MAPSRRSEHTHLGAGEPFATTTPCHHALSPETFAELDRELSGRVPELLDMRCLGRPRYLQPHRKTDGIRKLYLAVVVGEQRTAKGHRRVERDRLHFRPI